MRSGQASLARIVLAVSLALVACAPAAAPTPTAAPPTAAPAKPAVAEPTKPAAVDSTKPAAVEPTKPAAGSAAPAGAGTTLRLLMSAGEPAQSAVQGAADRFMAANPGVKVAVEAIPFTEFYRQVSISIASDDPADILWPDPSFVRGYVANGALLPLCCDTGDDAFTREDLSDFDPSLLASVTVDGKVYMGLVPDSGSLLYYNKEIFDRAGITPPSTAETGWTWQQWIEAMQKVKKEENGQVTVWGGTFRTNPPNQYDGMPFPRSAGEKGSPTHRGISDDGLTVSGYLDTPEAIQGLQVYQDLFVKYKLFPSTVIPDCFETGRCATKIAPAGQAAILRKSFPNLKWGVAPVPYVKTPITHNGSQSYVVAAKTRQARAARAFVRFAASREDSLRQLQDTFQPPVRKSLAGQYEASKDPVLLLNIDTLRKWGQSRPATAGFNEYNTITAKMFADIANGAPVADTVKKTAKDVDAQLAKYKK
jgi:fructooligosaccharide transport system substrate-binding protein